MKLISALNKIEEIERLAAKLYKRYHAYFFGQDKEASYFFYKMYLDEKNHRNLVQYVKRLARQNPTLFHDVDISEIELEKYELYLKDAIEQKEDLTLEEALNKAEELEITIGEGYLKTLPLTANPILTDLYRALSDKGHIERPRLFKEKMIE